MNIHYFLHKWCYASKNFKYVFWIFVLCVWSEFMAPFIGFNLWIGPGFIFELSS